MEETVIWEQHTVTLHRVGTSDLILFMYYSFFTLSSNKVFYFI